IQLKGSANRIHQPLVALKHLQRTGDAAHSKKCSMGSTKGRVGIRQAFPVGEAPRACDAQGIISSTAYCHRVRHALLIETERGGPSVAPNAQPRASMIRILSC